MAKSMREEVYEPKIYEANFFKDVQRIGRYIALILEPRLPGNKEVNFFEYEYWGYMGGCNLSIKEKNARSVIWVVKLHGFVTIDKRTKYRIHCVFYRQPIKLDKPYSSFKISVSNKKEYSKEEIERAEKSVVVRILEELRKLDFKANIPNRRL